jgi:hypothetical protein
VTHYVLVHGGWHGAWCWAALIPELVDVRALVYLAALLPDPGRSWREQLGSSRPMTDWFDNHALPRQRRDEHGRSYWPREVAAELFYHDCAPPVAADATRRLRGQAATPVTETTPVSTFPAVTTHYIGCRADRAVSPDWQVATVAERLGVEVTWIPGSHSPFLAAPGPLAQMLSDLLGTPPVSVGPHDDQRRSIP